MKYTLNSAAKEIACAFDATIGVRRTYGGGDNSRRMHITWQLVRHDRPVGMIDLICEDGKGPSGLDWHGIVRITAPNTYFQHTLLTPWHKLQGRRAKRVTRQRFFNGLDRILEQIAPEYAKAKKILGFTYVHTYKTIAQRSGKQPKAIGSQLLETY